MPTPHLHTTAPASKVVTGNGVSHLAGQVAAEADAGVINTR